MLVAPKRFQKLATEHTLNKWGLYWNKCVYDNSQGARSKKYLEVDCHSYKLQQDDEEHLKQKKFKTRVIHEAQWQHQCLTTIEGFNHLLIIFRYNHRSRKFYKENLRYSTFNLCMKLLLFVRCLYNCNIKYPMICNINIKDMLFSMFSFQIMFCVCLACFSSIHDVDLIISV